MGKKKAGKNAKISQSNAARDADIAQHSLSNRYVKIKGNKKDAQPFYVEDDEDEVDAFHRENDRIDLDGEDEQQDDDEIEDRRPRLELGDEFDQQDDDEDDEEDYAVPIPLRDSDDEKESKEPTDISKAWGKNKKNYYDADTMDFEIESDDDVAKAEEEEVKRLDKEKSAKLKEEDFDVATLEDLITNKKKKPDLKKKSKKTGDTLKDLELDTLENGTMEVERVAKDVSDLTKKDKLELLMSDSPELLGLLAELRTKLSELRDHIAPLIERVRAAKLPTSHGISLLEVKFHLLLNYVTNVAFYLMLKVDGQQVQHHPVIKQLVHLRTMMEKLKPIDAKLKYQIEKLIKQANTTSTSTSTSDPLSYKPNPDQLVAKNPSGDMEDGDGEVDAGDGIYRPPKMTAAHFDENEKAAKKRRAMEEKQRAKARSSGLVQHLRDELLSDAPVTYHMYGDNIRQEDEKEKDKREYEETNMLRLMETKAERNARKRKERISAMEDFEDFGDYDALIEDTRRQQQQEDEQLGLMKKKARTEKVDEILNKVKTGMAALNQKRKQPSTDDFSDDDDFESGTRAYAEASAKSRDKRAARAAAHPKPEIRYRPEDPNMLSDGSKRAIDSTIQRNRGLTRARPKGTKTPRTANREKYRKAVIRRKGQVQEFKGIQEGLNYSGEKTGIKKNVTKSVKIR